MGLVPVEWIAALTYLTDDGGISNITEQAKAVNVKIKANAESIIGLQPDLVIIPDWQPAELIQTIRDAGIAVYVYKAPTTIEEIKQAVCEIARVVGEEQKGSQVVAGMDAELAKIIEQVQHIPSDQRQVIPGPASLLPTLQNTGACFAGRTAQPWVLSFPGTSGYGRMWHIKRH
ncbi:ABC transporter substrate-binding protein [Sporomusa carbonis]|uniref:ABC transporter substrate-binding protein n=1 Tax=Sporomusa carbonis TaxID=3076075 RepID=UPI003C7D95B7